MINIELLYKLGFDYPTNLDFEVTGELTELKKFIKNIPDIFIKFEICQIAILKTYYVYQNLCIYLQKDEPDTNHIAFVSPKYRYYINLQLKTGHLYNTLIEFTLTEIEKYSNSIDPKVKKYLIQSLKNFDIIYHAKQVEQYDFKIN